MRDLKITPVLNGFVIKVGCQTVVFTKLADMLSAIENYYTDPEAFEKLFVNKAINSKWTMAPNAAIDPGCGCGTPRYDTGCCVGGLSVADMPVPTSERYDR